MGMEDDFGDLIALSAQEPPSFAAFTRISEGVCNDLVEYMVFNNSTSMVISPSAIPLDLNGFSVDGNFDWVMTINLPWFQLQQKLDLQELGSRTNSPRMFSPHLGGVSNLSDYDSQSQLGSVMDLAVTERHRLLGSLLDYSAKGPVSDLAPSFTSYFSRVLPERFEGELAMRVQQFFDPSYQYPLQRYFELAAFFVSNNKPTKEKIKDFLKWVIDNKNTPQLESFLRLDSSTTLAFSQCILEAAASMKNTDLLRSLLLSGAHFKPVIQEAIQTTDSDFIELLLSRVDPECLSGDSGGRLLLYICETNNVRAASILVENGANVNFNSYSYERWGRTGTPLYGAVSIKQPKMVRFLLDKGANVNAHRLSSGQPTAPAVGVWWNHDIEIVTLLCELLDAGIDLDQFGSEVLEKAVLHEQVETVALLTDRGTPVIAIGVRFSPLQAAACCKTLDLAEYLIDRGADANTPAFGYEGRTALQHACYSENLNMVKFLLSNKADVNAPPAASKGITALEGGLSCSATAAVKEKLFQLPLDNRAKVTLSNERLCNGNLIIHIIVKKGLTNLLEIALKAGANANSISRGNEGRTPLQLAAELGQLNVVRTLMEHGAKINAAPAYQYGRTALQAAAILSSPNMELLNYLVDNGAEANAPAGICGGITAMQGAAIAGNIPVVQYLWGKGALVNGKPAIKEGRTAIEGAAEHGRLDTVQLLLNYGATGGVGVEEGFKKAIELAEENHHAEIVKMLRSAQSATESELV